MKKDVKAALEKRFGKINSNRVILTNERLKHIKKRHPKEAALVQKHKRKVIRKPDEIYEDAEKKNTALFVKKVSQSNISLVVKLQVNQKNNYKNSIISGFVRRIDGFNNKKRFKLIYSKK